MAGWHGAIGGSGTRPPGGPGGERAELANINTYMGLDHAFAVESDAFDAGSVTTFSSVDVLWRELMATFAMCFGRIDGCWGQAILDIIYAGCDCAQVIRVNTVVNSADVVYNESIGDRPKL